PGRNMPPVAQHPRAAHEKIAADLAYDLGLPLPPVVLWEYVHAGPQEERYMAISAEAFPNAHMWRQVLTLPPLLQRVHPQLKWVCSAMAPFDTWVDNTDRHNDGNLLLTEDVSVQPALLRVAFIDYANSLSMTWAN